VTRAGAHAYERASSIFGAHEARRADAARRARTIADAAR
jgi:hypothetical protein